MILGLSDTEKKFKTAMDTAGADMTVVNSWLRLYVKTKKNPPVLQSAIMA